MEKEKNKMSKISVVMSTFNRGSILSESIEAILNQTFEDFEFIIVDDASSDNTKEIIEKYKDKRIRYIKQRRNLGCTFNYHYAQELAKGKYIAHIDDDDISKENRLECQYKYMEENKDVVLSGTYIETFGETARPSWVMYDDSETIDLLMNIYNPLCHSTIMYRKDFVKENRINYDFEKICSQDYDFYKQIILTGGKISIIPEILVKYKMHSKRITDIKKTMELQIIYANEVKKELLERFFNREEYEEFNELVKDFPFNNYDAERVEKALNMIKSKSKYEKQKIDKIIEDIKNNKFRF